MKEAEDVLLVTRFVVDMFQLLAVTANLPPRLMTKVQKLADSQPDNSS